MIRLVILLAALFVLFGMFWVLYTYRPVRKDAEPAEEEPFDYTSDIQEKLDEEEARLRRTKDE